MDIQSCFKILEIQETGSLDEIKQAYRDLIAIWHPDRYAQNPRLQEKATEKVKELNAAYNCLLANISRIKKDNGDAGHSTQAQPQQIAVICPTCQSINRFHLDGWTRYRKCIYCNSQLLTENFNAGLADHKAKTHKGCGGDLRKAKGLGFGRVMLLTAACIGCVYLYTTYFKEMLTSDGMDSGETPAFDMARIQFGKDSIMEIQRLLHQLQYDPGPTNGIPGAQTNDAVSRFVNEYAVHIDQHDVHGLLKALKRHAGIAQLHRDWPEIQKSADFAQWIDEQAITSPELCRQVVATGAIAQVSSLVDLYKFDKTKPAPLSLPQSGVVRKSYVKGFAPLTIQTRQDGRHYFVKLIREKDQSEALSAFLKSGFTLSEHVPVGKYRLKYAVGKTWYGEKWFFGNQTVFHTMADVLDFRFQGNEIKGYRLNLYLMPLSTSKNEKKFAFDF